MKYFKMHYITFSSRHKNSIASIFRCDTKIFDQVHSFLDCSQTFRKNTMLLSSELQWLTPDATSTHPALYKIWHVNFLLLHLNSRKVLGSLRRPGVLQAAEHEIDQSIGEHNMDLLHAAGAILSLLPVRYEASRNRVRETNKQAIPSLHLSDPTLWCTLQEQIGPCFGTSTTAFWESKLPFF